MEIIKTKLEAGEVGYEFTSRGIKYFVTKNPNERMYNIWRTQLSRSSRPTSVVTKTYDEMMNGPKVFKSLLEFIEEAAASNQINLH